MDDRNDPILSFFWLEILFVGYIRDWQTVLIPNTMVSGQVPQKKQNE
jgi:hypothetical protein